MKTFTRDELFAKKLPRTAIEDNIIDHTRWSVIHEIVFEHDGKFYQTTYSVGATENQDESPWDYDDTVECEEVHQVEKVIKVWEVVQ